MRDEPVAVNNRGVIATEVLANDRETGPVDFPAKVKSDVAHKTDVLIPCSGLKDARRQAELALNGADKGVDYFVGRWWSNRVRE